MEAEGVQQPVDQQPQQIISSEKDDERNSFDSKTTIVVEKGLKVQQRDEHAPQLSFSYALTPFMNKYISLDWTVIVSEQVECQHVRCHELKECDDLSRLIISFREELAVAVVLINKDDSYLLPKECCTSKHVSYPVIVINKKEGMKLLRMVEEHSESLDLLARVDIDQEDTARISKKTATDKQPGVVTELKAEMKRFMFTSKDKRPKPVSSDGTIVGVMSAFENFEKKAKGNHQLDIQRITKSISKHFLGVFADDFPFHMLLIYRILTKEDVYPTSDNIKNLINMFFEKMEQLPVEHLAEVFVNFLARGNFDVMFTVDPRNVFFLLSDACKVFLDRRGSQLIKQSMQGPTCYSPGFVYMSIMWTSLHLKLHDQRGLKVTSSTKEVWYSNLIYHAKMIHLEPEILQELCRGLHLQKLLLHSSQSKLTVLHLKDFIVLDVNYIRPFKQIKEYICATKAFLRPDQSLMLLTTIRSEYNDLPLFDHHKLMILCSTGKRDLLIEGIEFVDSAYIALIHELEQEKVQEECSEWLQIFIKLIDFSDLAAVDQLHPFILKRYQVLRDPFCKKRVKKCICECTKKALRGKSIVTLFPLFNEHYSMHIYPIKVIEDICGRCIIPRGTTIDASVWSKFFTEVSSRFGGDKSHSFVLDLFERLSESYVNDNQHKQFLIDILRLQAPKLLSYRGNAILCNKELDEDEMIPSAQFTSFLRIFIQKHGLRQSVLNDVELIISSISEKENDFQDCILDALLQEFIPEQQELYECSNKQLKEALKSLSDHISWPIVASRMLNFCWSIINKCCQRIPIDSDSLFWIHNYSIIISKMCHIFQCYKKVYESTTKLKMDIDHVVTNLSINVSGIQFENMKSYFLWIRRCQTCMKKWQHRLRQSDIRYGDFLLFVTYSGTGEIERICTSLDIPNIVDHKHNDYLQEQFKGLNATLRDLLIKTLPREFGFRSCTLQEVLKYYSFSFPSALHSQLQKYVCIQKQSTTLSSDKDDDVSTRNSYILVSSTDISLNTLRKLVKDLEQFLSPFKHHLDRLVFLKLYSSFLFHKHFCIEMHCDSAKGAVTLESSNDECKLPDLTTPILLTNEMMQNRETEKEGQSVELFVNSLERTFSFLSRLLTGQATYIEIVANEKIVFDDLDIDAECNVLDMYSRLFKIDCLGLEGVRSIVELSQYARLIPSIQSVCRQFNLSSCLNDPVLQNLLQMVNRFESLDGRQNLTPIEALTMVKQIKEVILIKPQICCDLFNVMHHSKPLYFFLREGQFFGEAGRASFQEHHQLITAQLQHEEYDEVVLNHLLGAFKVISPFLDNQQGLKDLMLHISRFDNIANGLKQLETVNTNIMIIRLWFARAKGDTFENIANDLDCVVKTGKYIFTTTREMLAYNMHLHYVPSQPHVSQSHVPTSEVEYEKWNIDQIGEFVQKLGFLDRNKGGGDQLKRFLKINEIAYKLLDLYCRLRELGHFQYTEESSIELSCSILPCNALEKVNDLLTSFHSWAEEVAALRSKYKWLLFFNIPKLLRLYKALRCLHEGDKIVNQIACEIAFLCTNSTKMRTNVAANIKKVHVHHKDYDGAPVEVVGSFLNQLFSGHSLPAEYKGSQDDALLRRQVLHFCNHFSLSELIQQIIGVYYPSVPKVFQLFRCQRTTTEEELKLFFERTKEFPLTYVVYGINKLSYKLQEHLVEQYLLFQQSLKNIQESDEVDKKVAEIHFMETVPSIMREMPWIQIKEQETAMLSIEEAQKAVYDNVVSSDFVDIKLVYGLPGNGKTHYIKNQLKCNSIIIAVNENFSTLYAINALSHLHTTETCEIFFNFTLLLPSVSYLQ